MVTLGPNPQIHEEKAIMYKRLYVPIDDSSTSKRALDEAVRFLKGSDAVLKVVHVIDLAQ